MKPHQLEHQAAGLVEYRDRDFEDPVENLHRPGYSQCYPLRALERQCLGRQLAQDDMEKGDYRESDSDCYRVTCDGRAGTAEQKQKERLEEVRERVLSNPAKGKTRQRYTELSGRDI